MSNKGETNNVPMVCSIKLDGITYCIDINDNIYIYDAASKTTTLVTDETLINKILDYLEAKPLDIV